MRKSCLVISDRWENLGKADRVGAWQKGKIRIRFEFVADKPTPIKPLIPTNSTSPLDDLRSHLDI
ncbi:KGK domain-containing protein [Nostoc sp.]|uniref:KGK domain-containing protein n=1 Tax=Nostoc sp. TaxID=1180 RepID=UPI002FF6A5D7